MGTFMILFTGAVDAALRAADVIFLRVPCLNIALLFRYVIYCDINEPNRCRLNCRGEISVSKFPFLSGREQINWPPRDIFTALLD